jgi:hypothetical protein
MAAPDYRIRFSPTLTDFATDVGTEGQDIDNFPAANQQARYDWMRIVVLGLLCQQASESAPTQYRSGTPWFDLNDETLKIRRAGAWLGASESIKLANTEDPADPYTLQDWFNEVNDDVQALRTEAFFYGNIVTNNIVLLPIPESLHGILQQESRPFVYVNGTLLNPATTPLQPGALPTSIAIPLGSVVPGDNFSVTIKSIPDNKFVVTPVVI